MPELPEIEIVKRSLFKMINKAKIIDIKINNKNLRYKIPRSFSKRLTGERILRISRKSKYLILEDRPPLLNLPKISFFFVAIPLSLNFTIIL